MLSSQPFRQTQDSFGAEKEADGDTKMAEESKISTDKKRSSESKVSDPVLERLSEQNRSFYESL